MDKTFGEKSGFLAELINNKLTRSKLIIDRYYAQIHRNYDLTEEQLFSKFEEFIVAQCIIAVFKGEQKIEISPSIFPTCYKFEDNEPILQKICEKNGLVFEGLQNYETVFDVWQMYRIVFPKTSKK